MRPTRSLLIYVLVVFAGGALIAPWLYWLVQALAPHSHLAANPFHRFVDRSLLGIALLGIWPLMRSLGVDSWQSIGLVNPRGQWKLAGSGFLLGFFSLAGVAVIVLLVQARKINTDVTPGRICYNLLGAAVTAVAVSVLEEILFRGAIFGALRKTCRWPAALLVSSMIYAIVHFFARADLPGPVTWSSGLQLLPLKLSGFFNLTAVIPGFFNLTLAGILLGLAYQRTGNLYFSIGLHAGWIFWLKFYGSATISTMDFGTWVWGTEKLIDGWMALVFLTLTQAIMLVLPLERAKETRS